MSGWFYGLLKQNNGKIRIWEIVESEVEGKEVLWGHIAFNRWMIKELRLVLKDLIGQRRYMKRLWTEKELEKGTKKIVKHWSKQVKEVIKKENGK